jgi:hypothetical protein
VPDSCGSFRSQGRSTRPPLAVTKAARPRHLTELLEAITIIVVQVFFFGRVRPASCFDAPTFSAMPNDIASNYRACSIVSTEHTTNRPCRTEGLEKVKWKPQAGQEMKQNWCQKQKQKQKQKKNSNNFTSSEGKKQIMSKQQVV